MGEISKPTRLTYWVARNTAGDVVSTGETNSDEVTTCGQPGFETTEDAGQHLTDLAAWSGQFPELPTELGAILLEGERYRYGTGVVQVRQTHYRTEHAPADVPALFLIARAPGSGIDWIVGEQVRVGTVRTYGGTAYRCIQGHVTQADWTPPAVPALWAEDAPSSPSWAVGVAYAVDEVVEHQGSEYVCLQAHTSIASWSPTSPGILGVLWSPFPG